MLPLFLFVLHNLLPGRKEARGLLYALCIFPGDKDAAVFKCHAAQVKRRFDCAKRVTETVKTGHLTRPCLQGIDARAVSRQCARPLADGNRNNVSGFPYSVQRI